MHSAHATRSRSAKLEINFRVSALGLLIPVPLPYYPWFYFSAPPLLETVHDNGQLIRPA
jgi:hypothetical protein